MISFRWLVLLMAMSLSFGLPTELLVCNQPSSFTVQMAEGRQALVYGLELLIRYDPRARLYVNPAGDLANVLYDESAINFTAHMLVVTTNSLEQPKPPEKIFWSADGSISGTAEMTKTDTNDYAVRENGFFLPWKTQGSADLPGLVEDEIRRRAKSCIQTNLCGKIVSVRSEDVTNIPQGREFDTALLSDDAVTCPRNIDFLKANINGFVDLGIQKVVKSIQEKGQNIINIPGIHKTFTMDAKLMDIDGYFEASGGTFEDLSTLKRTTDVIVSNEGSIYTISSGLGLSVARFRYDCYKMKAGFLTASGKISGEVNNVEIETKVTLNYSDKPCTLNLEHFKVTRFDKPKFTVTGMGPFSSLFSKLLNWITKTFKKNIVSLVEANLRNVIQEQLTKLACEKFQL